MKIVVAIIGRSLFPLSALAENVAPASRFDAITQAAKDYAPTMPSVSLPSMPDFSLPDFSKMGDGVMTEFMSFTQQVGRQYRYCRKWGTRSQHFAFNGVCRPKQNFGSAPKEMLTPGSLGQFKPRLQRVSFPMRW